MMRVSLAALVAVLAFGSAVQADDATPPPFFLQDPSDNLCLAGDAFKRCSIETLWYVVGSPGKFSHWKVVVVEGEKRRWTAAVPILPPLARVTFCTFKGSPCVWNRI
jgi:hypothetical protein